MWRAATLYVGAYSMRRLVRERLRVPVCSTVAFQLCALEPRAGSGVLPSAPPPRGEPSRPCDPLTDSGGRLQVCSPQGWGLLTPTSRRRLAKVTPCAADPEPGDSPAPGGARVGGADRARTDRRKAWLC